MHPQLRRPSALLALLALAACSTPPPPATPTTGTIQGTVHVEGGDLRGVFVAIPGSVQAPGADGTFAFAAVAPGSLTVTATKEGYVDASADAQVTAGKSAQVELTLTPAPKDNHAPVLSSFSANPTSLARQEHGHLLAVATDPDGDALTYTFSADEGWTVVPGTEPGSAQLIAPDQADATSTVRVAVKDGRGGVTTGALLVSTRSNRAPVLAALVATPSLLVPGAHAQLSASASDPDGDQLTYEWSVPEGWTVEGTGAQVQLVAAAAYDASATIGVTVTDAGGAKVSGSTAVATVANLAPVFASVTARPNPARPGATLSLAASATDPNGDALTFAWKAGEGWTVTGTGATATLVAPAEHGAQTLVEVTADDGHGKTTTASVAVSTTENQAPLVTALTATPPQARPGAVLALKATAADPDGEQLTYQWSASAGWTLSGSGAQVSLQAPALYGQAGEVQLTVTDPFGAASTSTVIVSTVQNGGPLVQSVVAQPAQAAPGAQVHVVVSATDPDGDPLSYQWTAPSGWSVSGANDQAEVVLVAPAQYAQSATVQVAISDGTTQVTASALVSTRANRAPQLGTLVANPNPVARGGSVQASVTATDPDGDALSYTWTVPDGWTSTPGATGDKLTLTAPQTAGARGVLAVTVRDGKGGETSGQLVVATQDNHLPLLAGLSQSGSPAARGGAITLVASASDPDGDQLTYTWRAPAGWTLTGTGAQVTLTAPNAYGQGATVSLTVSDGVGTALGSIAVATVAANRLPVITSIGATPPTTGRGGSITLAASASDPDGDQLTYTWTAPTGWSVSGTGAQVTLTAPNAYGQTGSAKLEVSDGTDSRIASVQVATRDDRAPTVASVAAGAATVLPGATTTLAVTASDPDNDPLTYSYAATNGWSVAGSGANVTLRAPFTNNATTTVTVTVNDGFGQTATGTVQVGSSACGTNTMNCDGDPANGCEAALQTDNGNCGVCANSCSTPAYACKAGTCTPNDCLQDWLVGTACNGTDYGGGCTTQETGYHWKGFFTSNGTRYACWWHTKNQAWNTTTASNFYALAQHFHLPTGSGGSSWCYPMSGDPCAVNACNTTGPYFQSTQVGAWGWCGGTPFTSGGFMCIPAPTQVACQ